MNIDSLLEKIKKNTDLSFLEDMPIELRSDYQFFMKAVQLHGGSLQYASEKIKNDKIIALEAIKVNDVKSGLANETSILYASETLLTDRSFILEAIAVNGKIYKFLKNEFKNDIEIINKSIENNPTVYEYLDNIYKSNSDIAKKAISLNPYKLSYAPDEIKNNKEIIICAVQKYPDSIQYASDSLKSDFEIAKLLVMPNENHPYGKPRAIQYLSSSILLDDLMFSKLIEINPKILQINDLYEVFQKFADQFFLNEDYKRAIETYQIAFKLKEVGLFLFNIAICYEKLDDIENAILNMNQCHELRIKNNSTKASINESAKKIKQYQKALK
jgi:tetratricopeptide (TPR) repeat protein